MTILNVFCQFNSYGFHLKWKRFYFNNKFVFFFVKLDIVNNIFFGWAQENIEINENHSFLLNQVKQTTTKRKRNLDIIKKMKKNKAYK